MKSIAIEPVWMHGAEHKKFDISPRVPVAAAADPTGKPGAVGGFRDASDENPAYLVRIRVSDYSGSCGRRIANPSPLI